MSDKKQNLMGDLVKSVQKAQNVMEARPERKAKAPPPEKNFKTAIVFYHEDVEAVKKIKTALEDKGATIVNFSTAVKTALRAVEIDADKLFGAYEQVLAADTRRSKTSAAR